MRDNTSEACTEGEKEDRLRCRWTLPNHPIYQLRWVHIILNIKQNRPPVVVARLNLRADQESVQRSIAEVFVNRHEEQHGEHQNRRDFEEVVEPHPQYAEPPDPVHLLHKLVSENDSG